MSKTITNHQQAKIDGARELDCTGLLCPLPVYKAALVLNDLEVGEVLRLITTDPGALRDIPAMAHQRGDSLLEVLNEGGRQTFLVQKGAPNDSGRLITAG